MPEPATTATTVPMEQFFPLGEPREKQRVAMDFLTRVHAEFPGQYPDMVIAAPTGIGKTGIGVAACIWAPTTSLAGEPGGYYLVTQKLLQDQLERDFDRFQAKQPTCTAACLKSASEYTCPTFGNCFVGRERMKRFREMAKKGVVANFPKCELGDNCTYTRAKEAFQTALLGITNYPYFMTERRYVGMFKPRQVLVLDECHTIERQILGFITIELSPETVREWVPGCVVPELEEPLDFCDWLNKEYLPEIRIQRDLISDSLVPHDEKGERRLHKIENHLRRTSAAVESIQEDPTNWVYWQESSTNGRSSYAKPLDAAPFAQELLYDQAPARIFMSAYPGPKKLFCRCVGLDPEKVAWKSLNSTFPVEHRPIHLQFCGSMGQKSIAETTPLLLRKIEAILKKHSTDKGVIHCHSYKLGRAIRDHIKRTEHAPRLLYAEAANDRVSLLHQHHQAKWPTVLLSPSMTEGFSLDDDLARFQIIAKVPYPYLGDRQVAAKKDRDPEWYILQTVMTIVQACGRIVRSDDDWGTTYILDSDFMRLSERYDYFFPKWFQDAFVWS